MALNFYVIKVIMKIPQNILSKLYVFYFFKRCALIGSFSLKFNKFIYGNSLKIGKNSKVWDSYTIKIIGKRIIVDSDFLQIWPPDKRLFSDTSNFDKEVKIGCNVWIGMNSIILKGAVIGDNLINDAWSTVTGEIPANCIAAGNPAVPIKYFTPL